MAVCLTRPSFPGRSRPGTRNTRRCRNGTVFGGEFKRGEAWGKWWGTGVSHNSWGQRISPLIYIHLTDTPLTSSHHRYPGQKIHHFNISLPHDYCKLTRPPHLHSSFPPSVSMTITHATESSTSYHSANRRNAGWSPETSPSLSESSESSSDSDPTSPPLSSESPINMMSQPTLSPSPSQSRLSLPPTTSSSSSNPSTHPYRPQSSRPASRTPSLSPPKLNLPKSQPLSRALFARMAMAEIPHAGMGNGSPMGKKAAGGKQKMIVATKPMRTTFELGLTSSELARRS